VTSGDDQPPSPFPEDAGGLSDQTFRSLGILARALRAPDAGLAGALQAIVTTAVATVGPAWHAGLITVAQGEMVPRAVTGPPPELLDQLQQKLGDGPCLAAARTQSLVRVDDLEQDTRWPHFAAEARSLGVGSMVCVPLRADERLLGTVSLYATRARTFTGHDERVAGLFATLAAIALADAQRTDQLQAALVNRDVIGQAKGILMERYRVPADTAFALLSRASQNVNMKLPALARHLTETGELPGTRDPA
jgi:GAF domain-containing protein